MNSAFDELIRVDTVVSDATSCDGSAVARAQHPWTGQSIPRSEDDRLLRGNGRFVADVVEAGMLYAAVLRSSVASGRIRAIDPAPAAAVNGVVAVLTPADVAADGLGGIPWEVCPPGLEGLATYPGDPAVAAPQPLLAGDRVRYVGEPLAFVLGETAAAAQDGAEALVVDIEEEEIVADIAAALARDPDGRRPEQGGLTVFTHAIGDAAQTDRLFADAAIRVALTTHVPRLVASPIETRGYLASFDADVERWTLVAATGKPHPVRDTIATHVLHVDPQQIRLVALDVGGGFGAKNVAHAEAALALWGAKRTGRPVRWIGTRNESFLSDMQGRDHLISGELALDADGRMLAMRYTATVNLGAYLAPRGVMPCLNGIKVLSGPYAVEAVAAQVRGVLTNTVPTCPYRGAGAPETSFVVERLIDLAAARLKMDPAELRRRNLLGPDELPWRSPTGLTLHSVDFPSLLERALIVSGWTEKRAAARGTDCRRTGIGVAFGIEGFGTSFDEDAEIMADGDGRIEIRIGTKSSGQSHETTYAQIAADALGLRPSDIFVIQGDTARIARGNGTGASRSLTTGGSAILRASEAFLSAARSTAAELLQRAPDEIRYAAGCFEPLDDYSGASVSLATIARSLPGGRLHVSASFRPSHPSFPAGCHVAEVEVDIDTGTVDLISYVVVHDAGMAVNPAVVEGQLHGGIAQGIGAALMEACRYDAAGQAITASFFDYAMPQADDLPAFTTLLLAVPCESNPLGAKAVGEAGTVASPPAVVNAIVDALADLGVDHLDLPATPERVWEAIRNARGPAATISTKGRAPCRR
jgi:carbon-monoxide dehydrogenase large subunit